MVKKKYKSGIGQFNFTLSRACRQCKSSIPDQAHASQEFCPKTHDENGKVRDCKTAFHRENDKPEREKQAEYNSRNKEIKSRIEFLVKKHGDLVSTDILDTYEIELAYCIQYQVSKDGILTSIFLGYKIVSNPFNNIHKISIHD